MNTYYVTTCLLFLTTLLKTGYSFHCYQCNSTLNHNCQEYFNHDNPNQDMFSSHCKMQDAKFCVKVTGLWGGIVGTHRFCSSRDLGNQCQDMRFPDHSRKYRGCVFTCTWEGCNAASLPASTTAVVLSIAATLTSALWRLMS